VLARPSETGCSSGIEKHEVLEDPTTQSKGRLRWGQGGKERGVPPFLESPLSLSDIAEAVGVPSRLSGKGQEFPTCEAR
jgi:hypothetical protein